MNMTKQEVIETLCKLVAKIDTEVFQFHISSDCFCSEKPIFANYQFDSKMMDFIDEAICEKIKISKKHEYDD